MLEEIPRSGSDFLPLLLGHLGVRAPYATRRKRRYEANQVWMNTTFILQGPQSWGKQASKPEGLRQINNIYNTTYNHYNYINLNPRLQNNCAKNILKIYTNICSNKIKQNLLQNHAKLIAKIKLGITCCKITKILAPA
jgi:hypothetical protein